MNDENLIIINDNLKIPLAEIQFRFSTSSGPGGQHVNKTASKATLLFNITHSPSLTDNQRILIQKKLAHWVDNQGNLQISVQESRSQYRNRKLAIGRLQKLLAQALKKPKRRKKSRPSKAAKEKRLRKKRHQSEKKRRRRERPDY
ncbi:MAG: aminoacyl-tRNA hydrolase [Chloroflexi bacterium]|nr:aminoacyl-tRNA hydrolase [Chloroflexota bacterium]